MGIFNNLFSGFINTNSNSTVTKARSIEQINADALRETNKTYNDLIRKEIEQIARLENTMASYSNRVTFSVKIQKYVESAELKAELHGGKFEMDSDIKASYDRLKADYEYHEKKAVLEIQEEQRKLEQERIKREEERIRKQNEEEKLLLEQKRVSDSCEEILLKANYSDVVISMEKVKFSSETGYRSGNLDLKKSDVKYSVKFSSVLLQGVPYEQGHAVMKSFANVLTEVDISDVETRDSFLKLQLEKEGFLVLDIKNKYEGINNFLNVAANYKGSMILLEFYVSKIQEQKMYKCDTNPGVLTLENSTDFDTMEGHDFEYFCANILKENGFKNTTVTQGSGDQGIDIIAFKDGIKYGIQCKCYSSDIGNKAVQEVFAGKTFYQCHVGVVLTNRYFTKSAIALAKKNGVVLWDREKLLELVENSKQ